MLSLVSYVPFVSANLQYSYSLILTVVAQKLDCFISFWFLAFS